MLELRGPRVLLREFQEADLEPVHRYAGDPEVARHLMWGPSDMLTTTAFLQGVRSEARQTKRSSYQLAVVRQTDADVIGAVSLSVVSQEQRRGEVGYVLRRDQWGQGLATEAASLIVQYGFAALHLHRIEATCSPDNQASIRVLEKLGCRLEGRLREHRWTGGEWRDSLLFAVLEHEWTGS